VNDVNTLLKSTVENDQSVQSQLIKLVYWLQEAKIQSNIKQI